MHQKAKTLTKKCDFVDVSKFIHPMKVIVDKMIAGEEVYVNADTNEIYIDLQSAPVLDCIRKGIPPKKAADSIAAMMESFLQSALISFELEEVKQIHKKISSIQQNFINTLRAHENNPDIEFSKAHLLECKAFVSLMYRRFLAIDREVALTSMAEIREVIVAAVDRKIYMSELRAWLVRYVKFKASNGSKTWNLKADYLEYTMNKEYI